MTLQPGPTMEQLPEVPIHTSFNCSHTFVLDGQIVEVGYGLRVLLFLREMISQKNQELVQQVQALNTQIADLRAGEAKLSADDIRSVLAKTTIVLQDGKPDALMVPVMESDGTVKEIRMPTKEAP